MSDSSKTGSKLSPEFRERLLQESKNPFRGVRRLVWLALFGSASIGLLIMVVNSISGKVISLSDLGIQVGAISIFGILLRIDNMKKI